MDERVVKFRVGVMVLSTLFIGGILVLLFSDAGSLMHGGYLVNIHFEDAPGVTEGTPVRKAGITIGRVKTVKFGVNGGVDVTVRIDNNVELFHDEKPEISGSLLGGDTVIQFNRRDQRKTPASGDGGALQAGTQLIAMQQPADRTRIQPDEWINGTVTPNPLQAIGNLEGDVSKAINSLGNAGEEVSKLAGYINNFLTENDDKIGGIIEKAEMTLNSLQRTLAGAEDVIGNEEVRNSLKKSISDLPELLAETRNAMGTVRGTVESMDRNLRNLEGLTAPLGERGSQLVDNIDHAVARLEEVMSNFSDFSRQLNRGDGTLGKLIRDPELYQRLNSTLQNVECLTRDLRPILADVRVFSDSIARHPEQLGVSGAIRKKAGIK